MKAAVRDRYGSPDVVELREIDKPAPEDNEVLVRVRAASLNMADWYDVAGRPYVGRTQMGLRKPKTNRLGVDYAGTVEAVGKDVTEFQPGDEVFGGRNGAFAEYVCAREDRAIVLEAGERERSRRRRPCPSRRSPRCRGFATRGSSSRARRS